MLRKYITIILLGVLITGHMLQIFPTSAVTTDGTASNWTREKAEHLARRVLFYPTPQKVDELFNAGSAGNAIDILFPDEAGPDRAGYEADMASFAGGAQYQSYFGTGNFGWNTDAGNMHRYYLYRYYHDPYEAKAKLSTLFEDIFSVNSSPTTIEFTDIIHLHDLLYKHTLGNYKTLVKRALLNNPTDQGDYAASEFLNLLRQWNYNNPNENYPREMLQLFLMGEYLPLESKDHGDERNYSEDDVASLARILTGFYGGSPHTPYADDITVFFTGAYHNKSTGISFLPGNTGGVSYPFYDSNTDTLDLSGMMLPILGNNGLGDNTVDYIFSKRSHAIALFLANKFYNFYVGETPTHTELDAIASTLETNNFEMLPTIKWMLIQDFFYSDTSMNAVLYYNPLELVIGLFRTLHASDPETFDTNFFAYNDLLSRLAWTPYFPGSIFGRDGYDANYKWFSAYTTTQWTNLVTTVSYDLTRTGSYQLQNIVPITQSGGTDITMDDFIAQVEDRLLLSRSLPQVVKSHIKSYLTTSETGTTISFQPNNSIYRDVKFPGVFALVLSSPEFILKSGYDQPKSSDVTSESKIENASGALIIIELPGGYDWLNGIIAKSDYTNYASMRTDGSGNSIAQPLSTLADLGDFYMNPYIAYSGGVEANGSGMKQLYDAGYLRIFNRVGTPEHSRDHNQAQIKSTSFDNTVTGRLGILGALAQYETNSSNVYVMGTKGPNILQGSMYVNLGANDNRFSNSNPKGKLNTNQRNQQISFLMASMTGRTYPGNIEDRYSASVKIHEIANLSTNQGGSAGVGYTTTSQLTFAKTLLDNNEGKIFFLQNHGNGYDTHGNELIGSSNLDLGIGKATMDIVKFFESVRTVHDITIVVFSEFGRTNGVNGSIGTDHGQGGGIFILSNNSKLLSTWTDRIYGKIQTSLERSDWLSIGIDYRTVYGGIIDALYGIGEGTFFPNFSRTLTDDLSTEPATLPLLHVVYQGANDTKVVPVIKFETAGRNFDITKGSYFLSSYSTGGTWTENTAPFVSKKSQNYNRISQGTDGFYKMDINDKLGYQGISELQPYGYSIDPITNQYVSHIYTGSIVLPEVLSSGVNTVSTGSNSVLRKYNNISVTSTGGYTPSGSGIILASNMSGSTVFAPGNGIQMIAGTGTTYITSLTSSGLTRKWNGGFIIGERMDTDGFIPEDAHLTEDSLFLSGFTTTDVVRVGADTLGIGMQLSQPVELTLTGATPNAQYYILTSEDGHNWSRHSYIPVTADSNGIVTFTTDHFSLFTLAQVPNVPLCSFTADQTTVVDGTSVNFSWFTLGADTVNISPTIGNVGFSGVTSIIPPSGVTTDYVLSALNEQGTGTCHVIIQSLSTPTCSLAPSIPSLKNGAPVTLTWTGVNTISAELNPGNRTVPPSGNITFVPPVNTTTNYILSVSNSVGSGSCGTAVSTYVNTAPIANNDGVNILENTSKLFDILSNDTDTDIGDTLTVASIVSNPVHGSAEISGTGILYTGTGGYCGSDTFSYRAQDQEGAISNTATVNVSISCGLNPPVLSGSTFSLDEDTNTSGQISGVDIDGDTLTYSLVSAPSHGALNFLSDGSFLYTPNSNYYGTDTFTAKANDGGFDSNIATFTLNVHSINDLPVAFADSGSTNMNTSTFIDILANDTDIDHVLQSSGVNFVTLPMSGSLMETGGVIEYAPTSGYCGTDSFEYSVSDSSGGTSNTALVFLNILCISGAPLATPDTAMGVEDTIGIIDFIANDTDPDFATGSDMISFHDFVTLPTHGTVTVTISGSATPNRSNEIFTYTPSPNYCGVDTFTYRVHDLLGNISNIVFATLDIACINDTPTVADINRSGYSNVSYSGVLSATDIDSSSFTYQIVQAALSGTVSLTSTGYYEYIPQSNTFSGTDSFGYVALDASGAISNIGTVIFSLTEAPVVYTYTGTDISSTGSAQILSGITFEQNEVLDLNGNSVTAISSSGSTGSIVLPGTLDILVESGMWSGEILAPSILAATDIRNISLTDAGVSPVLPANTPTMTYTYIAADTFKAGSEDAALVLTGGYADIEFVVDTPGVVFGSRLQLLRSQDGVTWEVNYPDTSCIVDNELKCTFRTNHLTYFGTVQQIAIPVVQVSSSVSGPGGYYSVPPVNPVPPGLLLGGTGYTRTGGLLPGYSVKSQAYIDWVKKYQTRYAEKYLAEKIYWDILKKNRTTDERIEVVDTTVVNMMDSDESLFDIALMISDLWEAKLAWKEKLKLIQK